MPSLHPDIQRILEARGPRRFWTMPVDEARAGHASAAQAGPSGPQMAEISEVPLRGTGGEDVPVRIYRPAGATGSALVYFHGGGWVLGSIDTHDRLCRNLAEGSGATVFNVGYRLAPEHPFPAAYDDAFAVTCRVLGSGADLGIEPGRVGVAGDSAGGNLAAAVAIGVRDLDLHRLRAQLLVYPAVDAEMTSPSYRLNLDGLFLSAEEMRWFYSHYQLDHDARDWRLSPAHAEDLSGLPPALIVTAEHDPLRDEGEHYALALADRGVLSSAVRYLGTSHGFFGWSHLAEPSRQAIAQCCRWLRDSL